MHYIYILDLDGIYRGFPMTFIHSKPQMPMPTRISKRQSDEVPPRFPSKVSRSLAGEDPAWLCQQFAIENGHRNSEFSHEKHGDFPVRYVNVYQRVLDVFWDTYWDIILYLLLGYLLGQNGVFTGVEWSIKTGIEWDILS